MEEIEQIFNNIYETIDNNEYSYAFDYINDICDYIDKSNNIELLKYIDKISRRYAYSIIPSNSNKIPEIGLIIAKLKDISILVKNKITLLKKEQYYEVITKLIYNERNNEYIKKILDNITYDKYILRIFEELLKKYVSLDNEEDITYYNSIITIFFEYDKNKVLINNKNKYINYLKEYSHKRHISNLINYLSNNYKISLEDLAKKYKVNICESPKVKKEKFKINYHEKERVDYTQLPTISIDTLGSECLDDAVSLVKNKDGSYYLYIFIIDIPSIIPYSSYTFKEALDRMETRYLITGPVEMYPKYLAYNLCSLNQQTKRCVISHRYLVDSNFNIDISSLTIERAYISVNSNLDYKQADRIIKHANRKHSEMINNLLKISLILRKNNRNKEEYRNIENTFNKSIYSASRYLDNYVSPNIIQELMVLVNYTKALYMKNKGYPYLYRNNISFSKELLTRDIQDSLEKLKVCSKSDYKKILAIIEEKYMKCFFSRECLGHRGLDYPSYAWTSSPSRRAPDSFNQYLEHQVLFSEPLIDKTIWELEELVDEVSTCFNGLAIRNDNFNKEYNYLVRKKMLVGSEKL